MTYSIRVEKACNRTSDQGNFTALKSHKVNFKSIFNKMTVDLNVKYANKFGQSCLHGESLLGVVECWSLCEE